MAATIDELQIEIQANATKASAGIDALIGSLSGLKSVSKGGAGLTTASKQFQAFAQAVQTMQAPTQKIAELVAALKPLETIGKSNLGSALNQLKKIPEITAGLDDAKLSAFAAKIQQVTVAVRPLAAEMEKVSAGFSKLPANIQRAINANAKLTTSNNRAAKSYGVLGTGISAFTAQLSIAYLVARRIARVIGGWMKESNDYVENLNLFTVAMGEYAESAQAYAEKVSELMGIDPSEWMRNQGVFNTLLTGFGVAADKSALMSKNLTQLGYDLSSFFNISFADSMQKLQSGISGELEPLRRLGYDLSQAKLEAIALSLGIDRSVSSMTQAEKVQLRYYAILTQVTTAQGDMARTLSAPANQLRILQAQATQAARALGNIFIPALNAVLPYAIAFLKVIRMVADAIASLFGFTLPEIDYSGVGGLASSGEDAADALDNAAGSAKKLKGMLAGFDELNVIASDSSGGGGSGGSIGGGDLGFKLPDYSDKFLSGLVESKVKDIVEQFKRWLPIIKKVGAALAVLLGAVALGGLLKKITDLSKLLKGGSGLLGTLSKVAVGVAGFAASFIASALIMYDFSLKGKELEGILVSLAVGFGGVGLVLSALLGPIGWVIAGIGTLTGIIVGLGAAQEQLLTEKVSEWFYAYGEGSITITQLADAYGQMADEIIARKQSIIDGFNAYEQGKESIANTSQELGALLQSVQYNTDEISKKLPEIKTAFDKLLTDTESTLASLHDNIILSLAGATGDAYTAMGGDLAAIYGLLDETFGAANDTVEANKQKISELTEQYNSGDISESTFITGLIDAKAAISSLTQDSLPEVDNFRIAAQTAFDGIDFENSEAVSEALGVFSEKTQAAKDAILEAAGAEQGQLDEVKRLIAAMDISLTPEQEQALADWQTSITTAFELDTEAINTHFTTAVSAINEGLRTAMQGVAEQASADWDDLSPIAKWWNGGSEAAYVEKALTNYRTNIVTPINEKLIAANGSIGSDVAAETDSMMDEVMAALFTYSMNGMRMYVSGFKTDIETAMAAPLSEIGKAMPQGVADGVDDNIVYITKAMKDAAEAGIGAYADAQKSGSPAKAYIEQSLFAMQGLKKGIDDNKYLVTDSLKSLLNSMLQMMEQFTVKIANALNGMLSDFASTMGGMTISNNGSVNFKRMQGISIQRFASGGFPVRGDLFIANDPIPEYVGTMGGKSAVANNGQIEAGIEEAAYRGFMRAMAQANTNGGETTLIMQVDERELGRVAVRGINKVQRQAGVSLVTT